MHSWKPGFAVAFGLILASVIQVLTQHFTDTKHRPVQEIAESTVTGPATTVLSGFSVGLESTVWSIIVIAGNIMAAFLLGNSNAERLYFIALTGMGMLTTVGVVVSMDTFGPISDNAQGIAEMSGEFEGRPAEILGGLDAIGNSTKAITKGLAIATAVIAATSLFGSFEEALRGAGLRLRRASGSTTPTCSSACCWVARSRSCSRRSRSARSAARRPQVVVEVRNQFRDHPGIMDYTEKPDYGRVVDICTKTSLRELMTPGLLAVLSPVIAGFLLKGEALGAFLAGSILTGQLLAVMLSNSGGAWDNAKKYIEEGHFGGKGSEAHKAAVIGDTVGDPFKDTAGPGAQPADQGDEPGRAVDRPARGDARDGHRAPDRGRAASRSPSSGVMIYISKSRKSELEDEIRRGGRGVGRVVASADGRLPPLLRQARGERRGAPCRGDQGVVGQDRRHGPDRRHAAAGARQDRRAW